MLYILYGEIDFYNKRYNTTYNTIEDIDYIFDYTYNKDWLNDDFAKRMIRQVDKSIHEVDHIIDSPYLGKIPPTLLSSGVKGLILYKYSELSSENLILPGNNFGDNCTNGIAEISLIKDIWMNLNHYLRFSKDVKLNAKILNNNLTAKTGEKLNNIIIDTKVEWFKYVEENLDNLMKLRKSIID